MSAQATPMTRAFLESVHPALFAQLREEFMAAGAAAGAAAETARIAAVLKQAEGYPQYAGLARKVAFETRGTALDLAQAMLAQERRGWADVNKVVATAVREVQA